MGEVRLCLRRSHNPSPDKLDCSPSSGKLLKTTSTCCMLLRRKIHFHDVNLIEEFKNFDLKILLTIKIFLFKNVDLMPRMQK